MRKIFKSLAGLVLIPFTRWYLRRRRSYSYGSVTVDVFPGVFHPGLFSSTRLILEYLEKHFVPGQTLLEVGSGTGLISVVAAKANLTVTALEISSAAVDNTAFNARRCNAIIKIVRSDVFANLAPEQFNWIVINPPYYARDPQSDADMAWYCGENFEYFTKLFTQLPAYVGPASKAIMVLTQGCDLKQIFALAEAAHFRLELIREKRSIFDGKDLLFELHHSN